MTKEKFRAFLMVQRSGRTNMFDIKKVIQLANKIANVTLTREEVIDIMQNYSRYEDQFALTVESA